MNNLRSLSIIMAFLGFCMTTNAEIPANYYASCEGLKGSSLLAELCDVVGPHTTVSYDGLWDIFPETDSDADGKMWDMYSTKRWTWSTGNQCGNYSYVGDCYNREHSMPKSWFSNSSPMYSDAFHLYPTDGKVNGQRSNFPYGECEGGNKLSSHNGVEPLGRLGSCTFPGYTGTVFEPDNQYKGDFARTYFYMAAAYNDRIKNWDSPMLAGNSYPAFTTWSVNLLLKWHREDPVSDKERNRNEAVYNHQHNRNPFIDHPDLAEHIWGDKKDTVWSESGTEEPSFVVPVEGAVIDLGMVYTGVTRYYSLNVRGMNFTSSTQVSVSGSGFSVSPATLTAQAVNDGTTLTIAVTSDTAGMRTGTLKLQSGSVTREVTLKAQFVSDFMMQIVDVTDTSFTVKWVDLESEQGVDYTLDVTHEGSSIHGYPVRVASSDERYTVESLEPETTYMVQLSSPHSTSLPTTVTTLSEAPCVILVYDGALVLSAEPGRPSDALEIEVETINVEGDITVAVDAPFQLSTDKATWTNTVVLTPDEDYFYIRLYGDEAGYYTTSLRVTAKDFFDDDVTASGRIRSVEAMVETFESGNWKADYNNGSFEGVCGTWSLTNAGVFEADSSLTWEGTGCLRLGKSSTSSIAMAFDHDGGLGVVSFMGKVWAGDPAVDIDVEYSTDNGASWQKAQSVNIPRNEDYAEYSAVINQEGSGRIRLSQKAGSRALIDNVKITSYASTTLKGVSNGSIRSWDAYCNGGELVIETSDAIGVAVYSIDAVSVFNSTVAGSRNIPLTPGLYIVVAGEASKRVVVK